MGGVGGDSLHPREGRDQHPGSSRSAAPCRRNDFNDDPPALRGSLGFRKSRWVHWLLLNPAEETVRKSENPAASLTSRRAFGDDRGRHAPPRGISHFCTASYAPPRTRLAAFA